jgi:hypothetical protein
VSLFENMKKILRRLANAFKGTHRRGGVASSLGATAAPSIDLNAINRDHENQVAEMFADVAKATAEGRLIPFRRWGRFEVRKP